MALEGHGTMVHHPGTPPRPTDQCVRHAAAGQEPAVGLRTALRVGWWHSNTGHTSAVPAEVSTSAPRQAEVLLETTGP